MVSLFVAWAGLRHSLAVASLWYGYAARVIEVGAVGVEGMTGVAAGRQGLTGRAEGRWASVLRWVQPARGALTDRLRLVLASFLMLFVELALIRWTAANVIYL